KNENNVYPITYALYKYENNCNCNITDLTCPCMNPIVGSTTKLMQDPTIEKIEIPNLGAGTYLLTVDNIIDKCITLYKKISIDSYTPSVTTIFPFLLLSI
ncbi:MAG TPA: hypothetical protein VHP12_02225, partial [Chitinophagaceae bacterium]|nr:hypothetical protein [Chitinophagaceae bacterium]